MSDSQRLPIKLAAPKAETYYKILSDPEDPEYEIALSELSTLVQDIMVDPVGDANDFHNFAVGLARNNLEHLACDVIRCGLNFFPKNCDLLSDFLQYGKKCGLQEECKAYYETLRKLPRRRYTWRGFTFSINYLEELMDECDTDEEIDTIATEMLKLSEEFQKYLPYEEDAYRTRANIYEVLREPDKEREVLEMGLANLKSAPKCALRLADILVDRGEYEEAMSAIRRAISDNNQDQSSISEGYLYYLSGRAKLGIAEKDEGTFNETIVSEIYSDFNIALSTLKNKSYKDTITDKVNVLRSKTGIEVPDRYENLRLLIEE